MPRLCRGRLRESVVACVRLGNIVAFDSRVGRGATVTKPPVSLSPGLLWPVSLWPVSLWPEWGPAQPLASTAALGAGCQLFLLDREDLAGLELEIAYDAGPLGDVGELGIVAARRRIRDPQPLVRINSAIFVVLALVGTPVGRAGGRQIEFRDGVARQIPEAHGAL